MDPFGRRPRRVPPAPSRSPTKTTGRAYGGGAFDENTGLPAERGIITDYYPATNTYAVRSDNGRDLSDVERLLQSVHDSTALARGTHVLVNFPIGTKPIIMGVLKAPTGGGAELNPTRLTEVEGVGGEDPVYAAENSAATARGHNDPSDVLPDDWVQRGPDGNLVAVLAGGTTVMKGSPQAQIRAHGSLDMVEIIASRLRQLTAMGELNIVNDGGKTSLVYRAGADQLTETGSDAEHWTIHFDLGAAGDMLRLKITTPTQRTLGELHIAADGKVSWIAMGGHDITTGPQGNLREDVGADRISDVRGARTDTTRGEAKAAHKGNRTTSVSKNDSSFVGGNANNSIGGDRNVTVGGHVLEKYTGGSAPKAGNVAAKYAFVNGGVEYTLGDTGEQALPLQQAFNLITYGGALNFILQAQSQGGFNVMSPLPGSVQLGCDGAAVRDPTTGLHTVTITPASFHAMLYEQWSTYMDALLQLIDTHTHPAVGGSTGPPVVPTKASTLSLKQLVKSQRVLIGL